MYFQVLFYILLKKLLNVAVNKACDWLLFSLLAVQHARAPRTQKKAASTTNVLTPSVSSQQPPQQFPMTHFYAVPSHP